MDQIKILIRNNKEFGDIALLVDKEQFLEDVKRLRIKWGIKELIPIKLYPEWREDLVRARSSKQQEQNKLKKQDVRNLTDPELEDFKDVIARVMPDVDFECDIRDLRIKFNKPETFDKAIAYSVICGVIPSGIYKTTYYEYESSRLPERLQDRTSRIGIYVTPQSTEEDILRVFRAVKGSIFKPRADGLGPFFNLYNKDQITNIKRDRDWYWRNLKKDSYKKIAVSDNEKLMADKYFIEDYAEKVRKAIKRYREALSAT
jgi:hypothetical protein